MSAPLRVMAVMGTRPDTIKMAPVVHALQAAWPEVEKVTHDCGVPPAHVNRTWIWLGTAPPESLVKAVSTTGRAPADSEW